MEQELAKDDAISVLEAADFVSYNTLRALDYMQYDSKPIILVERWER